MSVRGRGDQSVVLVMICSYPCSVKLIFLLITFYSVLISIVLFKFNSFNFYTSVSRRAVLCDWVWRVGGRPHRFLHNNFSSVYQIFTKLGHVIPLWKGKNPIYFGVIRSKVKVTITVNIIFDVSFPHDNFSSVYWIFTKLDHMIALWKRENPIYFGVIRSKVKVTVTINIIFDNRVISTWYL